MSSIFCASDSFYIVDGSPSFSKLYIEKEDFSEDP